MREKSQDGQLEKTLVVVIFLNDLFHSTVKFVLLIMNQDKPITFFFHDSNTRSNRGVGTRRSVGIPHVLPSPETAVSILGCKSLDSALHVRVTFTQKITLYIGQSPGNTLFSISIASSFNMTHSDKGVHPSQWMDVVRVLLIIQGFLMIFKRHIKEQ